MTRRIEQVAVHIARARRAIEDAQGRDPEHPTVRRSPEVAQVERWAKALGGRVGTR